MIESRLRAAGCVFAEEEAALLRAAARDEADLSRLVEARVSGQPLEVLVGWAEFCGLRVVVDPGVFVPRQRTSYVVRLASAGLHAGDVVVDLCCGTGAIGAALAATVPGLEVYAADVEPAAVRCARRNLPPGRVHEGDLYDALPVDLRGRVDVLAVNAPYVPHEAIALMPPEARLHEPAVALDGGPDGLDVQRRVVRGAGEWLAPGGRLLIETSVAQAPVTRALMASAGLDATVHHDDDLDATVVVGSPQKSASSPAAG
ncbi:putative protein N(5)-glutamine methyltransferase [Nocardioides sp. W7]|uniref:putative protein N(5)-glutamine methyltransferase n=1 Tax=Nocardioides sp. W7 TaxID=2931390 RepID=UPI001FD618B3|nr:putative protein N(5)-glutamine methyltransferase [Nocardioides sp. W7]